MTVTNQDRSAPALSRPRADSRENRFAATACTPRARCTPRGLRTRSASDHCGTLPACRARAHRGRYNRAIAHCRRADRARESGGAHSIGVKEFWWLSFKLNSATLGAAGAANRDRGLSRA